MGNRSVEKEQFSFILFTNQVTSLYLPRKMKVLMLLSVLTILLGLSLGKEFLVETANSASDGQRRNWWALPLPEDYSNGQWKYIRRNNPEPNPAEAARRQFNFGDIWFHPLSMHRRGNFNG